MKEATLKQAGKVLEVIGDTPCDQLQKLLGSGLFSDLLLLDVANIDSVDRNVFRRVIGLEPLGISAMITSYIVSIDYNRSVKNGIKAGNYDLKNNDITSDNFPSREVGTRESQIKLFHFGKIMGTDEVLGGIDRQGYRPIILKELLALGEKYPNLQRKFPIIGLGSVWRNSNGPYCCPCLDGDGLERDLSLYWIGSRWDVICRFAAVRK